MTRNFVSRMIAISILGILLASYVHHFELKWRQQGREAYLEHEAHRFDRSIASPRPLILVIVASNILAFVALGIYELIVLALSRLLKSSMPNSPPTDGMANPISRQYWQGPA